MRNDKDIEPRDEPEDIIEDEDGNQIEDNQWERRKRKNKWKQERLIDDYEWNKKGQKSEDF